MAFESVRKQIKTTPEDIFVALQQSADDQTVLGIFIKEPASLITTAVKNLSENTGGDIIVELMESDLHGYAIENPVVSLHNIDRIIAFNIRFNDPQYERERRKERFKV